MNQKNKSLLEDDDHYLQAKFGERPSFLAPFAWFSSFLAAVHFFN